MWENLKFYPLTINHTVSFLLRLTSTDTVSIANTVEYSEVLAHPAQVLLCRISVKVNLLDNISLRNGNWWTTTMGKSDTGTRAAISFLGGGVGMGTLLCI